MNTTKPVTNYYRNSRWIIDVAMEMRRKGILGFFMDAWRSHGDLAQIQIGPRKIVLAIHPEHVRHISISNRQNYDKLASYDVVRELLLGDGLVASRGDLWRRQRRLMAPFFTPRAVESYYDIIASDGLQMLERWEGFAHSGQVIEMIDEMMLVTASIILRSMFSTLPDEEIITIKGDVETMIHYTSAAQSNPFRPPLWIRVGENARFLEARERVHKFINNVIAARRAVPEAEWPDDLLSKLMQARDPESGASIPDSLLRDESITIFFAGHETTARTLTFMFYALAKNPDVAARLHAEVIHVLGSHPQDVPPSIDDLKQLPYTLQVIKETLRLYPPAPMYVRDAVGEDVIDGIPISPGTQMMLLPFATHRHPDFWDHPEKFDPDRWTPEAEAARHPYAYHPFAAGQRICIGNNFSLFESHILTAMLARRFIARLVPADHEVQLEMAGTLYSKNGVPMQIELN